MAYAIDIISNSYNRTKNLFFPIRTGYWIRMGIINLFGGRANTAGSGSGYNTSRREFPDLNFSELIVKANSQALLFLHKYGLIMAIVLFFLYLISLFFTYINSVFTFVFIDGLIKKDIKIIKGFKQNSSRGLNLFFLKFIAGLITLLIFALIFSPLIMAFFSNTLSEFNYWFLIPVLLLLILFLFILGIFWFIVYEFVIPVMYFKNYPFITAWKYFWNLLIKNKLEVFIYWAVKLAITIGSGMIVIIILIPIFLAGLIFILPGVLIYFLFNLLGQIPAIIASIFYGIIVFVLFILFISILLVPLSGFFRIYSIEMLKKLESK